MLLGIDLGTSSLKVLLLDECDGIVALEKEPLEVLQPSPDRAEAEPEAWWRALTDVLARIRSRHPGALTLVRGVGMSTVFPALVPLDRQGRALTNAMLYCDRRSVPQVEQLGTSPGRDRIEARTGNMLTPGTCTLPGIVWLRENRPDIFRAAYVFGEANTFLIHRLTGEFVLDFSRASLSGLVKAGSEDRWDEWLLSLAGLGPERLPRLLPSTGVAGHVTRAAAQACGLPEGTPVVAGAGDAPLAAMGGGVVAAHRLFCSAGSTDCLMFTGDKAARNPAFANCRFVLPHLWVSIGAMSTGGASVKWFCDDLLHCSPDQMTAWAEEAEAGSGGTVFLPYLQGERTPWWDPKARAVFYGVTLGTHREHMCRSVFEGVAFAWRQIISLLEQEYGFRAEELTTVGGGSANRLWNQIKASVLSLPVRVVDFAETASLGAALAAGIGTGILSDGEDARSAAERLLRSEVVDPVPAWVDTYEEVFALYDSLYPTLRELMHRQANRG